MGLPKLGVVAEFLLGTLPRNAKRYDRYMKQMGMSTEKLSKSTAKSTDKMARSFVELAKESKTLGRALEGMTGEDQVKGVQAISEAFRGLAGEVGVNVKTFDSLMGESKGLDASLEGATGSTQKLAAGAVGLGTGLAIAAAAIGIVVTGTKIMISTIKDSIEVFQTNALALRDWQLQLGGSTEAISKMVIGAELLGSKMSGLRSGFGIFEKNLADYDMRMAVGDETTNRFARTLGVLDVDLKNADGSLRTMEQLLPDISDRFKELGPGITTTGLAYDLFGRSSKDMLPFLFQGAEGLRELEAIAAKTGATMTSKDVKAAVEFQKSMVELEKSVEGVKIAIARGYTPATKELVEVTSGAVQTARRLAMMLHSAASAALTFAAVLGKTQSIQWAVVGGMRAFDAQMRQLTGVLTAQEKAVQGLNAAEEKRLQTLVKARAALADLRRKETELTGQMEEKALAAEEQFTQRWSDVLIARGRSLEDAETATARKRADLWRGYENKLNDILASGAKKRVDRGATGRKKFAEFETASARQREKLLTAHLMRMEAIQDRFGATASEAARRNDAVALLRARRQKALDEKLETKSFSTRRAELEKDISARRAKLQETLQKQAADDQKALDDAVARAKLAYERQLENLALSLARQEEDRQKGYARQEADFDLAEQRQADARQAWFGKENDALQEFIAAQEAIIGDDYSTRETLLAESLERQSAMMDAFYTAQAAGASVISSPALRQAAGIGSPPPRAPSPRMHSRAEGGIDIVSSPTHYVAGDAGREMAAFFPMSGNVQHNMSFDTLNVGGVSSASERELVPLMVQVIQQVLREGGR